MQTTTTDYRIPPARLLPPVNQLDNECYSPQRSYEAGYTDGRWFSGVRRPGANRGLDANYDMGFALGCMDRAELD